MRLKRDAYILKRKAVSSLGRSADAYNSHNDDGRGTAVLLHLQHAFEMLLKAALKQADQPVFEPKTGWSIGFDRCVNLARETRVVVSDDEAGLLRAVDALRDNEQHWYHAPSEQLLYAHCRAAFTLFDDILQRVFFETLVSHLPLRVLPLSADPPRDIQLLLDEEFSQIAALLRPGRYMRHEATARLRSLLALNAHFSEGVHTKPEDVERAERAIRAGASRSDVLPNLNSLATVVAGEGLQLTVRFARAGLPVRYTLSDESDKATAIKVIDLQAKYHWGARDLADKLGLPTPRCKALRWHLGIEENSACCHVFTFLKSWHPQYSDNALKMLQDAVKELDVEAIYRGYRYWRRTGELLKRD